VLVVDDSLTVRELERKLLEKRGYAVTVAVDGMDGWNALRGTQVDLVVTDIDMPRMDGIELVTLIKRDAVLKTLPVMIVSYKDREEDRRRGLDAGADYYLAKGSFHDEALLDAVRYLIGEARALTSVSSTTFHWPSRHCAARLPAAPSTACCGWRPTVRRRSTSALRSRPTWC
jgi:two-component system sensor histidine kinase and response regulator WspE